MAHGSGCDALGVTLRPVINKLQKRLFAEKYAELAGIPGFPQLGKWRTDWARKLRGTVPVSNPSQFVGRLLVRVEADRLNASDMSTATAVAKGYTPVGALEGTHHHTLDCLETQSPHSVFQQNASDLLKLRQLDQVMDCWQHWEASQGAESLFWLKGVTVNLDHPHTWPCVIAEQNQ